MKISTEWLNEYVDIQNISNADLANQLTMTGTKVEGFKNTADSMKDIVIGKIISIEKHKNADSLFVCQVDIKTKTLQIVTRADNIKVGALVPVCLDGGLTANGIKIKKSKLRGEISDGMMCSIAEVGLSKTDVPYAVEDGIFLIEENCEIGQNFCDAFNLNETIFDFEITSNRPDCLCAVGLAREICATFNLPLKFKPPKNYCENTTLGPHVEIKTKKCLRYMAKKVENVKIGPSPSWLSKRLNSCGVQSINNIVDITNYVMLELGVPMHAFDAAKIENEKIVVRNAQQNETLNTLAHTTAKLDENDVVVCDAKNPLAVAGVIGGENSMVDQTTKTIILEVACFDGASVRKTSQKISARTESSLRFEKNLNPNCCELTMNRACELIESLGAGTITLPTTDVKNFDETKKTMELKPEKINNLIGFNLSEIEMIRILNSLEIKTTDKQILIPPHRIDLENDADIAEEIARIYGYNKIESKPQQSANCVEINKTWQLEQQIRQALVSTGCSEILTYSFTNLQEIEKLGLNIAEEEKKIVEIKNPFGEETRFLKTSTIPAMIKGLALNFKNKQSRTWLFEIGKTYEFDENKNPKELKKVTIGIYDLDSNFFTIKGIVEALMHQLKIENLTFNEIKQMPFHDFAACNVFHKNKNIGVLGQIHPKICSTFKLCRKVFVAVLNFDELLQLVGKEIIFKPVSKFPESQFDLTLICDEKLSCGKIEQTIKNSLNNIFKSCEFLDIWHDKSLGENNKSISFKISIQSNMKTLSGKEIDSATTKLLGDLEKIGATIRTI